MRVFEIYKYGHLLCYNYIMAYVFPQATDNDQANTLNSQVFYRLPNTNQFTINQQTGAITTVSSLDYETRNQYVLIVEASDSAASPRTGTTTVTINVQDVQDRIPLFVETAVTASVRENAGTGTFVIAMTVSEAFGVLS